MYYITTEGKGELTNSELYKQERYHVKKHVFINKKNLAALAAKDISCLNENDSAKSCQLSI
jgi:hypothetical protein